MEIVLNLAGTSFQLGYAIFQTSDLSVFASAVNLHQAFLHPSLYVASAEGAVCLGLGDEWSLAHSLGNFFLDYIAYG